MAYNLAARGSLAKPVDLEDLFGWYCKEVEQILPQSFRHVAQFIGTHWQDFVRFPTRALLLWLGSDRKKTEGKRQKYHVYPPEVKAQAKLLGIRLDARPNGPAIASFAFAGGERPERLGSTNDWTIHHLYSGKFPYVGRTSTTHAVEEGRHFTQSAGLITVHPVADALCDEYPSFSWLLRALAFQKFGYDPDGVFSDTQDEFGFLIGRPCVVFFREKAAARATAV